MAVVLTCVYHFRKGERIRENEDLKLGPDDVAKIVASFGLGQAGSRSAKDDGAALVAKAKDDKCWFLCDCGDASQSFEEQAVIFIQQSDLLGEGSYYNLRRDTLKRLHLATCPFYRDAELRESNRAETRILEFRVRKTTTYLGVYTSLLVAGSPVARAGSRKPLGKTPEGKKESKQERSLAAVLDTLFYSAGLQVTDASQVRSYTGDWARFRTELGQFDMYKGASRKASYFSATSIKEVPMLKKKIMSEDPKRWSGFAPHGLVFDVINNVEEDAEKRKWLVNAKGERQLVTGRIFRPGALTPSPWFMVGFVAARPGIGETPTLMQAYLHPLASFRSLQLVDSGLERETLDIIDGCLSSLDGWVLSKPNLEIVEEGNVVRPDFVIEFGGRRCFVETMGYDDDAYLKGKEKQHANMKAGGASLLLDSAGGHAAFEAELTAWLQGVS